jgi:hypothetical protein
LSFNWPYDYFSIVEMAKIQAAITFKKPDDVVEEQRSPQISGISPLGPFTPQGPQAVPSPQLAAQSNPAAAVKASTATRIPPLRGVRGIPQKQISVNKKSNVADKVIPGLKFSKAIKF